MNSYDSKEYSEYIKKVDDIIVATIGLGIDDISEVAGIFYMDYFENGFTAQELADDIIEGNGFSDYL
jgi:hypothetical protein